MCVYGYGKISYSLTLLSFLSVYETLTRDGDCNQSQLDETIKRDIQSRYPATLSMRPSRHVALTPPAT